MKLFAEADVCLKITVEEDRCTVAEMDFISLAIMYRYGGAECGRKNIPVNPKDSVLPAGLYSVTVLPASRYQIFFTPGVPCTVRYCARLYLGVRRSISRSRSAGR